MAKKKILRQHHHHLCPAHVGFSVSCFNEQTHFIFEIYLRLFPHNKFSKKKNTNFPNIRGEGGACKTARIIKTPSFLPSSDGKGLIAFLRFSPPSNFAENERTKEK